MKQLMSFLGLAFLSAIMIIGIVLWYIWSYGHFRPAKPVSVTVEIPYGSSVKRVAQILQGAGLVTYADRFYWYVRLFGDDSKPMQAGYYVFEGSYAMKEIAERLLYGQERAFRVTFREGETIEQLAQTLIDFGLATEESFIKAMTDASFLQAVGVEDARQQIKNGRGGIEGYLYPETYFISKRHQPLDILRKMHKQLLNVLDEPIEQRMREVGLDLHTLLTLASIVEKETGQPLERPLIASVYLNRLKKGMRLQADPTVIYGLMGYDGTIRKADLKNPHPYNTYVIKGLPPGPIAAVGLPSIRAVLWPSESSYLYFVSKNDGTHEFCENLSCHNRAVKRWQIDYFKKKAQAVK